MVHAVCKQLPIEADLTADDFSRLSEEDFEIFAGEEGVLVVDVLEESMNKKLSNKNSKEYETLMWEQKIRKEQAKKNVKKLSKEEQELVNEQLAKESAVRSHVSEISTRLKRGIRLVPLGSHKAFVPMLGTKYFKANRGCKYCVLAAFSKCLREIR